MSAVEFISVAKRTRVRISSRRGNGQLEACMCAPSKTTARSLADSCVRRRPGRLHERERACMHMHATSCIRTCMQTDESAASISDAPAHDTSSREGCGDAGPQVRLLRAGGGPERIFGVWPQPLRSGTQARTARRWPGKGAGAAQGRARAPAPRRWWSATRTWRARRRACGSRRAALRCRQRMCRPAAPFRTPPGSPVCWRGAASPGRPAPAAGRQSVTACLFAAAGGAGAAAASHRGPSRAQP